MMEMMITDLSTIEKNAQEITSNQKFFSKQEMLTKYFT